MGPASFMNKSKKILSILCTSEITVHCSNLQKLMVEIYECINYTSPSVLSEFFVAKEIKYDLRMKNLLKS